MAIAGHRGDVPTIEAHLADRDPVVRATALRALDRAGALGDHHLRVAAADDAPTVRRAAAEVIGAQARVGDSGDGDDDQGEGEGEAASLDGPTDDAVAVSLLALLGDADPTVAEVASWAAGERAPVEGTSADPADAQILSRLIDLVTDHDDALVREAAVAALGARGDERGLPAILAATADRATVRRRAVLALAPFAGPEVDAALERARADRDRQVRQAAEDLLAEG